MIHLVQYYIAGLWFDVFTNDQALLRIEMGFEKTTYEPGETENFNEIANAIADETAKEIDEYFHSKRTSFSIPINLEGTAFRKKVWRQLLEIPYGKLESYKSLAEKLGNKNLMRAVGGAVGANPIPIIVPCHRIINANGNLGGYSAAGGGENGLRIKKLLLVLEESRDLHLF